MSDTVPTEADYLDAARANAAVYFAESGLEGFGHYFDETAKRIAKRPDFIAAVDSAYAAGWRARIPEGWRRDTEWAVEEGGHWTSEPFYRRDHAERKCQRGQRVVRRRLIAEHWQPDGPDA